MYAFNDVNAKENLAMRFSVFTHVIHTFQGRVNSGYPPYIREMNIWLKYVDEVEVVASKPPPLPKAPLPPKGELLSGVPYDHYNIIFTTIPSFDLLKPKSVFKAVFKIPVIFFKILGAMRRADHLHLRCPGNIGLIACFTQMFFPGKPKTAKYAGNWDPESNQPWSYKFQRWILSNTFLTRNMTVLVYGDWPGQSKNILPFFTASFSESEIEKTVKDFISPFKFLFVGNLVPGKQPAVALQIVDDLNKRNIPAELHVYGDGELMDTLQNQSKNKSYIHLHGNHPLEVLKQAYKDSHFLILASKSEGWPKAVAEAMFFGCIPVVTPISCVPWMLGGGSRGILIPGTEYRKEKREKRNVVDSGAVLNEAVDRIIDLIQDPEEMKRMSLEAQAWSQEYTLEKFEKEIKKLLAPQPLPRRQAGPKGEQKK